MNQLQPPLGEPNPIIAVFRSTARTIADLENEYAALEAEVAGLRASATRAMRFQINTSAQAAEVLRETERERDEARALLREVSSELIYGRHPAQCEHHLAGKVCAALGEGVEGE